MTTHLSNAGFLDPVEPPSEDAVSCRSSLSSSMIVAKKPLGSTSKQVSKAEEEKKRVSQDSVEDPESPSEGEDKKSEEEGS